MSAKCSSCGADIVWAQTVNGKPIPLNRPTKRFILVFHSEAVVSESYYEARMVETYESHFSDCPNSGQHRKPK